MAAKTRAELKAYFETNDVPTEAQFAELIDNLAHVTDGFAFQGVLAYDTVVAAPSRNVFYIAEKSDVDRVFDDCGGLTVYANELAILKYTVATTTWSKELVGTMGGTNVMIYDTPGSYTYTKLTGTKLVQIICIGGGGGGGSGARGAAGTNRSGGVGGSGGNYSEKIISAEILNPESGVVVGAGGVGGASVDTTSTNGNAGGNGGESSFEINIAASGGGGGAGGIIGNNPGDSNSGLIYIQEFGAHATAGNFNISHAGESSRQAGASGASGCGITSANVPGNGTAGGSARNCTNDPLSGGTAGLMAGDIEGGAGDANTANEWYGGAGGGGGASFAAAKPGNGGRGGRWGGGGGGGAASENGYGSGAGGDGGSGLVVVIAIF